MSSARAFNPSTTLAVVGVNQRPRYEGLVGCLLTLALLLGTNPAMALEFCVGTITELNNALTIATSPTGQTTVIKIKQGTYNVGGGLLTPTGPYTIFRPLELQGGYNSDCSSRTINPDNTVFDAGGAVTMAISVLGTSLIEGIRFQNLSSSRILHIDSAADNVSIRVHNNAFVGVSVYFLNGRDADGDYVDGLFARFINNRSNGFPGSVGSPLAVYVAGASHVRVVGNTIADNIGEGLRLCGNDDVIVSNNIAWNNTSGDIRIYDDCSGDNNPGDVQFKSNMFGNVVANPVGDSANNFPGTNPLFVNPGSSNYRLQNASPAINVGTISGNQAAVDLAGNPRVVGSTVDIGGYESSIDDTLATTQIVSNSNDSGAGSLRQAILNANANPDFSFINFNIPGSCPRTISPSSDLPAMTQGVRIDAFSQPGSAANTRNAGDNAIRCVLLNGADVRATGLRYSGPSTSQFWLQGLAIGGFTSGLIIDGGTDALVWGNQFGGAFSTFNLLPNDTNIVLTSFSSSASIGGSNPAQLNMIAAANDVGISINSVSFFASNGNEIVGNLIGTFGSTESGVAGNGIGIRIRTAGNTVRDNVIVHSDTDGLLLEGTSATDNTIEDNRIGTLDSFCTGFPVISCNDTVAPNARHGISLTGGAHDNYISSNTIWNNGSMGISIAGTGKGNNLSANSIFRNDAYGIDLVGVGLNDNDADPNAQNLPNRGLNYPSITRVIGGANYGWIEGSLNSTNGGYGIQVYSSSEADNQVNGEGQTYHQLPGFGGLAVINNAPTGQNGSTSFRFGPFSMSGGTLANRWFALTATDGMGNTSEYSFRVQYQCDVIFTNGLDNANSNACPTP